MDNPIKLSSQRDTTILASIKEATDQQEHKLQNINEAPKDYIEKTQTGKARPHIMKLFQESLLKHDTLYKKLAK